MRKLIPIFLAALAVVVCVVVFRAETAFPDVQFEPAELRPLPQFDEAAAVERLAAAVRIPTVSHDDRSDFDAEAFLRLHALLEESFPRAHERARREVVGGHSLLYTLEGSDPSLPPALFAAHLDVVPVDPATESDWHLPPFGGVVADGSVWGRGTLDDKNGVAGLLEAMEAMVTVGFGEADGRPRRTLLLAFGHDEEVGGGDGAAAIAAHLAERGVKLAFVLDEGGVVKQDFGLGIDRPVAVIGVAEKGYVNSRLIVEAQGGHSSKPPAETALGILARALVRIEDQPFPATLEHLQTTLDAVGSEVPFLHRALLGNLWLTRHRVETILLADPVTAATLRTTSAPTMAQGSPKANILPTRAEVVINHRILPGDTAADIRRRLTEIIDDERVRIEMDEVAEPSPLSPRGAAYELLASTVRGMDPNVLVAPYLVIGGTDAKHYAGLTPNVYRFMMVRHTSDSIALMHGIDERIAIDDYLEQVRFYAHLLRRAGSEPL